MTWTGPALGPYTITHSEPPQAGWFEQFVRRWPAATQADLRALRFPSGSGTTDLSDLLTQREDSAAVVLASLPTTPENYVREDSKDGMVIDAIGTAHFALGRWFDGVAVHEHHYGLMLDAQIGGPRVHKGKPLVRIGDCYERLGYRALAQRHYMLALIEDILETGSTETMVQRGSCTRLMVRYGMARGSLESYSEQVLDECDSSPVGELFPEWFLTQLDNEWQTEYPTPAEGAICRCNSRYVAAIRELLGQPSGKRTTSDGKVLEVLAKYLLSCMPGCKTSQRLRTPSTDYDLVCTVEGLQADFRSELGRYFVCECKDKDSKADFTTLAKFCRVLDSVKAKFGVIFARRGLTGEGKTEDAEREQLKVYQDRGIVIVVFDDEDLGRVEGGENFLALLRRKYERVRLDLDAPP